MVSITTKQGKLLVADEVISGFRELWIQGILGATSQGRLNLKISIREALRIVGDDSTNVFQKAILCWLLDTSSGPHKTSEVERREIAKAVTQFRQRISIVDYDEATLSCMFEQGRYEQN